MLAFRYMKSIKIVIVKERKERRRKEDKESKDITGGGEKVGELSESTRLEEVSQ